MYLRTTRRKNKNGSKVEYYQLAHNERHPESKHSVARIIHSFGRADELDREELLRLCQSIARVCDLKVVDLLDESQAGNLRGNYSHGLPKEVKTIKTLELGCVTAIETLWERLGIGKTLRHIIKKGRYTAPYERALLAMTANRLCEPESKLGVWERWRSKVYLPSCDGLKLEQMYEALDFLFEHAAEVEKSVFFHTANLLNLNVNLIFYDTTTASFFIDEADEDSDGEREVFRRFGCSKEGTWSPQVIIALAVTREGLPVRCWVFPGNASDAKTVERIRLDLRGWNLERAMFVADSGMNSQENREELGRACGKYILAARMASVGEIKKEVLSKRGCYQVISDNLQAKEVIVGDGERRRRYILCYNPKEAKRQHKHRLEVVAALEKELNKHSNKRATAKWALELLASKRYKRYLTITANNQIRIDRKAVRAAERYDGKWVLQTNDDTISVEDAACGYKGLLVIERCFRSLKRTQIKMTPMFHRLTHRIEAHVRICVLALLIERMAELSCDQPWFRIRRSLEGLQVTKYQTATHIFFQRNEISQQVKQIFKSLKIPLPKQVLRVIPIPKTTSET